MTREIKFRGKSIPHKTWWVGMLININEKHANAVIERINKGFPERTSVEINSVGMYTGLHDSKGNEIFEGDILKTALSEDPFGVVIWHPDGYFCMDTSFGQLPLSSYKPLGDVIKIPKMIMDPKFEVIGNRTDNPELMESGGHEKRGGEE